MKVFPVVALAFAVLLQDDARAQVSPRAVSLTTALTELRSSVNALPPDLQSQRLRVAAQWLAERPSVASFTPSDVSAEYARSLQFAAELLKQQPSREVVEDVTAELEAKVEHCRKLGIGMGGLVTLSVNTVRRGEPVKYWRVQALLKLYERLKNSEPRTFLRVSTPTEMELEPGRYWVWALDPTTGKRSERVLVVVTGQKKLEFDLTIP
jgi:hypothetical protein